MSPKALTSIEVNMEEVHDMSCGLLKYLKDEEAPNGASWLALVMSIGRIVSPKIMSMDEEVAFLQNMVEFVGMYFSEPGESN